MQFGSAGWKHVKENEKEMRENVKENEKKYVLKKSKSVKSLKYMDDFFPY